jgi:hypothetical protein
LTSLGYVLDQLGQGFRGLAKIGLRFRNLVEKTARTWIVYPVIKFWSYCRFRTLMAAENIKKKMQDREKAEPILPSFPEFGLDDMMTDMLEATEVLLKDVPKISSKVESLENIKHNLSFLISFHAAGRQKPASEESREQ